MPPAALTWPEPLSPWPEPRVFATGLIFAISRLVLGKECHSRKPLCWRSLRRLGSVFAIFARAHGRRRRRCARA
jgi:hypothetical protein